MFQHQHTPPSFAYLYRARQNGSPSANGHDIIIKSHKNQCNDDRLLIKKNRKNKAWAIMNYRYASPFKKRRRPFLMTWHVYIIECNDGSLYTGITNDLDKRITAHNAGLGAKYTKSRRPVNLRYSEAAQDRKQAIRREYVIKSLQKSAKINLIDSQLGKT